MHRIHNGRERSLLSQFRFGILPLKIETVCYSQVPPEYRLCFFCKGDKIENEQHFFFECSLYDLREAFLDKIIDHYPNFPFLNNEEKLEIWMNSVNIKSPANYINGCFIKRQSLLYN